jgi:hypothetical protein
LPDGGNRQLLCEHVTRLDPRVVEVAGCDKDGDGKIAIWSAKPDFIFGHASRPTQQLYIEDIRGCGVYQKLTFLVGSGNNLIALCNLLVQQMIGGQMGILPALSCAFLRAQRYEESQAKRSRKVIWRPPKSGTV